MINMISFASSDKIEKQKGSAEMEPSEAGTENFAAFFSVPVQQASNSAGKASGSDESALTSDSAVKANQNWFETAFQKTAPETQSISQAADLQDPAPADDAAAVQELSGLQTLFAQTQNGLQAKGLAPAESAMTLEKAESLISKSLETGKLEILNVSDDIKGLNFSGNDFSRSAISSAREKAGFLNNLPELFGKVSNIFKNESSAQPSGGFQTIGPGNSPAAGNGFQTAAAAAEGLSAVSFDESSAAGRTENNPVVAALPQITGEPGESLQPNALQTAPGPALKNLIGQKKDWDFRAAGRGTDEIKAEKGLFGQLDSFFQTENESQTITAAGQPNGAGNQSNLNFSQPEIQFLKAEKRLKASENFSAISFERILAAAPTEQKTAETTLPAQIDSGEIFEQVEPQMLELLNLKNAEDEKKVMKMRLHPAELGMVEIKLEKDASGRLNAYFQTENEATRQSLTESVEQLRSSLENSGWQIDRLEISTGSFSQARHGSAENESGQFERAEKTRGAKADSENSLTDVDDLKPNLSNRLLSVHA